MIQAVALFGPHGLGLPDAGRRRCCPGSASWRALGARGGAGRGGLGLRRLAAGAAGAGAGRAAGGAAGAAERGAGAEVAAGHGAGLLRPPPRADRAPAEPPPDVTIWSETAVPFVLGEAPELLAESAAAAGAGGRLVLGIRRVEPGRRRALVQLARGARPGRDGGRDLRQAPPRAVRRVHPASPALVARLGLPGARDADPRRLHRRRRAAPRRGAGPAAVPAADLLRGDLPAARCGRPRAGPSGWCR